MRSLSLRLRTLGRRWNPGWTKPRGPARHGSRLQVEGLEGRALLASITEFLLPQHGILPPSGSANQIVAGPDGNLWFTENDTVSNAIGRITPSGQITEFKVPTDGGDPFGITVGPDGNLWFTENFGDKIGRITPSGQITEFPIGLSHQFTEGITTGPDGNLWFAENGGHAIAKMTTSGQVTQYPLSSSESPVNITVGPNGNLWFTDKGTHSVGQITTSGAVTEYPLPSIIADPTGIVTGPRGQDLWVTEDFYGKIAQISSQGQLLNEYTIPSHNPSPNGITVGPDGNIWFAEQGFVGRVGGIGVLDITSGQITELAIPGSNPQAYGITRGPDGQLWFTDRGNRSIGAINIGNSTFHSPPTGSTTPPTVSPNVQVQTVTVRHKTLVTGFVLSFSEAMNPIVAEDPGNYLIQLAPKNRKGKFQTLSLASALYNRNAHTVTLRLMGRHKITRDVQITVEGQPPGGLIDVAAHFLDGARTGTAGTSAILVVTPPQRH
jgi:streptogramin lyase